MDERSDNSGGAHRSPARPPVAPTLQPVFVSLLDELVNVMFCAKDVEGRYVAVNPAFVRRSGRASRREVIGLRATDLFPAPLAERYEHQDARIIASGRPLRDELELIRRPDGRLGWYLTTKLPVVEAGVVTGVVSTSRDLQAPDGSGVDQLNRVVELVRERLGESLRVADLAAAAGCSEAHLKRQMKRVFGLTPVQYILRVRVDRARLLLSTTEMPLTEVALAAGFYDQASLTRRFARLTGETPAHYRAHHRSEP